MKTFVKELSKKYPNKNFEYVEKYTFGNYVYGETIKELDENGKFYGAIVVRMNENEIFVNGTLSKDYDMAEYYEDDLGFDAENMLGVYEVFKIEQPKEYETLVF